MTIDTTQALLIIILVSMCKDGLLMWCLIARGDRATATPAAPPVAPGPVVVAPPVVGPGPVVEPPKPPVVVPPVAPPAPAPVPPAPAAPGIPRFTGIETTCFAGVTDSDFSKRSAYTGKVIDSTEPGAALPYHFPGTPPVIRVFCRGKTVDCPIVDVGPWNTHDPYWDTGARPEAETGTDTTGRHTNRAGLDLTPGAWAALGKTGNLDAVSDITSWDFVSVLDKGNVAPPVPVPPVGPAQPATVTGLQPNTWPTQAEVHAGSYYGNPADAGWEAANLVSVTCPWELSVEGTKSHTIRIHRKCAASLTRILNYIWEQAGKSQAAIDAAGYNIFDGSYNYRPMRTSDELSMHAYGAAMDWNADKNQQGFTDAESLFKSDGLMNRAMTAEGLTWGGTWSGKTRDPMHWQFARVR